jgi:Type I restriction enzyme R protein N terminus (HSDR_N)
MLRSLTSRNIFFVNLSQASGARTVPLAKLKQLTTSRTEADLAARIDAAVRAAFPWLPPNGLRHQTSFEFKFGHKVVQIDGAQVSKAQARSDVLVFLHDTPLAVLELKRESASLMPEDQEQGLSYARMLHPRPPLVVVTNGKQTITLASHTGVCWEPETPSEAEIKRLIEAAGQIAAAELRQAVEVLLGPASTVWVAAIRKATKQPLRI